MLCQVLDRCGSLRLPLVRAVALSVLLTAISTAVGLSVPLQQAGSCPPPLGIARDFTVFVEGDLTQSNTDAEGRLGVGGNATVTNYGAGLRLPNSNGTRDDFIVGGNLT